MVIDTPEKSPQDIDCGTNNANRKSPALRAVLSVVDTEEFQEDSLVTLEAAAQTQRDLVEEYPELMESFGVPKEDGEENIPSALGWIVGEDSHAKQIVQEFRNSYPDLMRRLDEVDRLKRIEDIIENREDIYSTVIDNFRTIEQAVREIVDKHPEWAEDIIENSGVYFDHQRIPYALLDFENEYAKLSKQLSKELVPIYRDENSSEMSINDIWKSIERINDIYPGLLKKQISIERRIENKKKTTKWRSEVSGQYEGIIADKKLLQGLSSIERFALGFALDSLAKKLPYYLHVREVNFGRDFILLRNTKDLKNSYDWDQFRDEVKQEFSVYEEFFFGGRYNWHELEKSVVLELLMRVEKDRREKGLPSLKESLRIGDWEAYEVPTNYSKRLEFYSGIDVL